MARDLIGLIEKAVPVKVDFGDGDVYNAKFLPHEQGKAEAEALQAELEASEDKEETKRKTYEVFTRTFKSWDLKDAGEVIPLTVEGLGAALGGNGIPATFLTDFLLRAYSAYYQIKTPGRNR